MQPNDRLVCAFVRPITVGDSFQVWPLHVTVVPWFRLEATTSSIVSGLAQALKPVPPFTSTAGTETRMGPRRNRPAILLEEPTPFQEVEQRVRTYFHKKRAWLVDETTKKQRSFRPHVTFQRIDRLKQGDRFVTDQLFIVAQQGSYKQTVGEVTLLST